MNKKDKIDLRQVCVDHAVEIRLTQAESSFSPVFAPEVIDDADMLYEYVMTGKRPEGMRVAIDEKSNDK